jgi:putative transposase
MDLFRCEDDYELFSSILQRTLKNAAVEIHAYVFMRNHFHLLMTPREQTALERAMHRINLIYARHVNYRYRRTGAVFEGRYRCTVVETERYWHTCMRYVELNPVRAGIVADPREYRWSSYVRHAFGRPDPLVTVHPLYVALGRSPGVREAAWRAYCGEPLAALDLDSLRHVLHTGGILGTIAAPDSAPTAGV